MPKKERDLYFFLVVPISPRYRTIKGEPTPMKRTSVKLEMDFPDKAPCGSSQVHLDSQREPLPVIFTMAESIDVASQRLLDFAQKNGLKIMPMPLDWNIAQELNSKILKLMHLMNARTGMVDEVDFKKLKATIQKKIGVNKRWTRKFEELYEMLIRYEKKPAIELKLEILDTCAQLNIMVESSS